MSRKAVRADNRRVMHLASVPPTADAPPLRAAAPELPPPTVPDPAWPVAILGVPFYGYGFGKDFRDGGFGYADILAKHPEAHEKDRVGETIWHNGQPTIREKAKFVVGEGLGGVMIWSLDNDVKGEKSLLEALHGELVPAK